MWMQLRPLLNKYKAQIIAVLVVILVTLAGAWYLWKPDLPVQQVYHPEAKQADGSVVAEVKPDDTAKPAAIVPKGSKVERIVRVTLRAKLPTIDVGGSVSVETRVEQLAQMVKASAPPEMIQEVKQEIVAACQKCPDISAELDLITDDSGQRRAVIKSDGQIISALDIPVTDAAPAPAPKLWAAGAVIDPFKRAYGAFVDRDIGFIRAGIQINQRNEGDIPNQVWIKAGIRF